MNKYDIGTFKYPDTYGKRNCIYEEALACIERRKDSKKTISSQMSRYKRENYPTNNKLVETSILVRRNTTDVARFCHLWWKEVAQGSRRDQLSFNYISWLLEMSYAELPGSRICNPFSEYFGHLRDIYK